MINIEYSNRAVSKTLIESISIFIRAKRKIVKEESTEVWAHEGSSPRALVFFFVNETNFLYKLQVRWFNKRPLLFLSFFSFFLLSTSYLILYAIVFIAWRRMQFCSVCGEIARKRCIRCKQDFYCSLLDHQKLVSPFLSFLLRLLPLLPLLLSWVFNRQWLILRNSYGRFIN